MGKTFKKSWIAAVISITVAILTIALFAVNFDFASVSETVQGDVHAEIGETVQGDDRSPADETVQGDEQTSDPPSDLGFTLINGGTEYKVRAINKQITSLHIPVEYEGKPVTEIADNGFGVCRNLTSIYIPPCIKRIGTNAFYGCTNLESVYGASTVETIGNNAFANCTKLKYFRIPKTIVSLGKTIFRNDPNDIYVRKEESVLSAMSGVSADWANRRASSSQIIYDADIICEPVDGGYKLVEAGDYTGKFGINVDLKIRCSYTDDDGNTYPIVAIEDYAFASQTFDSLTIEYDPNIDKDFTVDIGEYAFSYLTCSEIRINVNTAMDSVDDESESNEQTTSAASSDESGEALGVCEPAEHETQYNGDIVEAEHVAMSDKTNGTSFGNTDPTISVLRRAARIVRFPIVGMSRTCFYFRRLPTMPYRLTRSLETAIKA